jgi:hypothetical protein
MMTKSTEMLAIARTMIGVGIVADRNPVGLQDDRFMIQHVSGFSIVSHIGLGPVSRVRIRRWHRRP